MDQSTRWREGTEHIDFGGPGSSTKSTFVANLLGVLVSQDPIIRKQDNNRIGVLFVCLGKVVASWGLRVNVPFEYSYYRKRRMG